MPKVWNSYDPDCPKDAVYIGRPSKWGNPFSHRPSKFKYIPTGSAMESVSRYKHFLETTDEGKAIAELAKVELKGKDLRCFNCKPCHGTVLLEIANPELYGSTWDQKTIDLTNGIPPLFPKGNADEIF